MLLKVLLVLTLLWQTSNCTCTKSFVVICETVEDFVQNEDIGWDAVMIRSDNSNKNDMTILDMTIFRRVDSLIVENKRIENITFRDKCIYESHLKTLIFFNNKLPTLSPFFFSDLIKLDTLQLAYNKIEDIEEGAFGYDLNHPQIKLIDLSENLLQVLLTGSLGHQSVTEVLLLNKNQLTCIEANALPQNLIILNLDNNQIRHLQEDAINYLEKLRAVYLNHNKLLMVPNFNGSTHLEEIELSHNQISSVLLPDFKKFKKLRVLDLGSNHLSTVDFLGDFLLKIKSKVPKLYLSLAYNRLRDLDFGLRKNVTLEANQLILFGNPWNCKLFSDAEAFMEETKLNQTDCENKYIFSGDVPFCIVPLNITETSSNIDSLLTIQEESLESFYKQMRATEGVLCSLKLEKNAGKTLSLYRPTWRRCAGERNITYDYY